MKLEAAYDELNIQIRQLTENQLMALASTYTDAFLEQYFEQMQATIGLEAKQRVQSKVMLTFNRGYATGSLFDSIYYVVDGGRISVRSTKNYFAILNAGYDSFDMKAALAGQTVRMRLPGGRFIYRAVGDQTSHRVDNLNPYLKTKKGTIRKYYTTKNWIHPGYRGAHIFEQVGADMDRWTAEYVRSQISALIETVPDIPYEMTQEGFMYYNRRDQHGRFVNFDPSQNPHRGINS